MIVVLDAAWVFYLVMPTELVPNQAALGSFGNFFGGILTPLLSFCSFMGVLCTIILQNEGTKLTREQADHLETEVRKSEAYKIAGMLESRLIQLYSTPLYFIDADDGIKEVTFSAFVMMGIENQFELLEVTEVTDTDEEHYKYYKYKHKLFMTLSTLDDICRTLCALAEQLILCAQCKVSNNYLQLWRAEIFGRIGQLRALKYTSGEALELTYENLVELDRVISSRKL